MRIESTQSPPARPRRNPIIRLFSSIWFGLAILTAILIYSSIVSALPPVRWALEMTEMQAFRHWLFVTLVVLFVLALLTATLLRVPWVLINAGGLTAHIGLLLLTGGALAYFGTKVEGDVLLHAPAILVRANIGQNTVTIGRFRAEQGATWSRVLPHHDETLSLKVLETQSRGVQPAAAAKVSVQIGSGEARVVNLTNAPDDWQAIDDIVDVGLVTFSTQTAFYDDETPALYIMNPAAGIEVVREIDHLPIHRERYLVDDGLLVDARGTEIPPKRIRPELRLFGLAIPTGWFERWRMPIAVDTQGLPFTVQITGYVPYVHGVQHITTPEGQIKIKPVLEVRENRPAGVSPRSMSAIRLKILGRGEHADWSVTRWCLFSSYPDVDARPIRIHVPGTNSTWELIYSRARRDLGATLAARKLSVTYFPGRRGIESFRSDFVVQEPDGRPRAAAVSTNQTVTVGRWTLFQSGFDFEDHWRYTILGVGNRVGMWPMNVGWIVTTLGCLYAFYVKPVLLRRMKERA